MKKVWSILVIGIALVIALFFWSASKTDPVEKAIALSWTAPGDDNYIGTAVAYEVRYSSSIITAANWNKATVIPDPPVPQVAGSAERFEFTLMLEVGVYYFAIKTVDEVPNWSGLSNVVGLTIPDELAPGVIMDLVVEVVE